MRCTFYVLEGTRKKNSFSLLTYIWLTPFKNTMKCTDKSKIKVAKPMRLSQNFCGKKIIQLSLFILLRSLFARWSCKISRGSKTHWRRDDWICNELVSFWHRIFKRSWLPTGAFLFIYTAKQKLLKRRFNLLKISWKKKKCKVFVERSTPNVLFAFG